MMEDIQRICFLFEDDVQNGIDKMVYLRAVLLLVFVGYVKASLQSVLDKICNAGDLSWGYQRLWKYSSKADALHALSALEVILHANITGAVSLHRTAKSISATTIPPLAQFHLQGKSCGGLGDLFYVTAVITKQMVDSNIDPLGWQDSLTTLITLSADSGLYDSAERLLEEALSLSPDDSALRFRAALMTPGVYPSLDFLHAAREKLLQRVTQLYEDRNRVTLKSLDEFVLSPTFYYIYQGYNDVQLLSMLQDSYATAYSIFGQTNQIEPNMQNKVYFHQAENVANRRIRVGFVSSYFRRHSICKLFCGVMTNLDASKFEVFAFSSLQADSEDAMTKTLRDLSNKKDSHFHYVSIGKTFVQNRDEVLSRRIDVLIYLDIGMEPATSVWASARLAPIQACIWGHPTTSGLAAMDYYLSAHPFHVHHFTSAVRDRHHLTPYEDGKGEKRVVDVEYAQSFFREQLVQFDTLGFYFNLPSLIDVVGESYEDLLVLRPPAYYERIANHLQPRSSAASKALLSLAEKKQQMADKFRILLCPQHLPKFHPSFDEIMLRSILQDPNTVVVLVDNQKKSQWKRTLMQRWKDYLVASVTAEHSDKTDAEIAQLAQSTLQQIVWMPSLNPQEYLLLLGIGDVMLDQFPFGGGVTTLEALAVCTPVVTLPELQNVPQLAAGMLRSLHLSTHVAEILMVQSKEEYLHSIDEVMASSVAIRGELCSAMLRGKKLFEDLETVQEWNAFLGHAVEHLRE